MKLEHTREEYEAYAEDVKRAYFEAKEELDVKLKPWEAEINELDQKIANAENDKANIKPNRSHRLWITISIVLTVIAEAMYAMEGNVVIGYSIAAAALISLVVFFVMLSKNKKALAGAQDYYDSVIAKLEDDKLAFGSDDQEIVDLRNTMSKAEEEYAACLKLINEAIIQETLGGNGVIVFSENRADVHFKASVGGVSIVPQLRTFDCDAVVKIDGASRGSAIGNPLFVPVSYGLHNYSVEFRLPECFKNADEIITLPNGGYFESQPEPIKFEGEVLYYVYRCIRFKNGLEWLVSSYNNHVDFCDKIGFSVDKFMEYVDRM